MVAARLIIEVDDAMVQRVVDLLDGFSDPLAPEAVRAALVAALGAGEASGGHFVIHLKHEGKNISGG